jgi:hypothetical protein
MVIGHTNKLVGIVAVVITVCLVCVGDAYSRRLTVRNDRPAANCARTSVGFPALTDMGSTLTYQGYPGGLYLDGANRPPLDYRWMGRAHAAGIVPLDSSGHPDPVNGRIVLLSIGMSNTTQEFSEFKREADPDPQKNPKLTIVDGAVGGQDASIIRNPNASYWLTVTQHLTSAGVTPDQVEVAWLKEAIAGENRSFPVDAQGLRDDLRDIVTIMESRFPHLQIIYLASRTYAGYATTTLNPEPYAYESGYAVKWLIEEHIVGNGSGAWLAWGPYIWTDGMKGRGDGFTWACSDTQSDGTHPSASGQQKIAQKLLAFLKTDETAVPWFVRTNK